MEFDRVEHDFILKVLNWICILGKTVTNNCNSSVILKCSIFPQCNTSRGVRHGCPIFPYLFLIVSQLLAANSTNSNLCVALVADRQVFINWQIVKHYLWKILISDKPQEAGFMMMNSSAIYNVDRCKANLHNHSDHIVAYSLALSLIRFVLGYLKSIESLQV